MIRLGYVGINTELPTASRTFRLANYTEQRMLEVARANVIALGEILQWNDVHGIRVFRITSGLIPFGSHPVNSGSWKTVLRADLEAIGEFVKKRTMRVSMHPGQYTVLNTPNPRFLDNAIRDLQYHADVLDILGVDPTHKIILHGGGIYGEREKFTNLLIERFGNLPEPIRNRIVLENDERNFSAEEIYKVCTSVGAPAVFDRFHHEVNPSFNTMSEREIIVLYKKTWHKQRQKIHYSDQAPGKHRGAHSERIDIDTFSQFYRLIADLDLDIMLETKDKQESVLRLQRKFGELVN